MTSPALSDAAVRSLTTRLDWPDAGDRFDIRALIGQGGMGRVYRVFDTHLERELAMKVLSLDADTPELARRMSKEARVLAKLEHPGIVAIHDAGVLADGRPFYLMRLIRGTSLHDLSPMPSLGERLRVFLRVCDAVAFAHARGVVHRDLKPGNVMIGEYGEVVVLDWGIAKVLQPSGDRDGDDASPDALRSNTSGVQHTSRDAAPHLHESTADGVVVGTPGFMAPEQAAGVTSEVDARADIFSLGALLRTLVGPATAASSRAPAPLQAIVSRAMAGDPGARYQRVESIADDIRAWMDGDAVSAHRETVLERAARFGRRNRTLLLLLLAYVIARLIILFGRGI